MGNSLKITLVNLALVFLLFGFLFRITLNESSDSAKNINEITARLSAFQEDVADLRLEISTIKQSLSDSLIPVTASVSKVQEQSQQLDVLAERLEQIEKEANAISDLKEAVKDMSISREDLSILVQDAIPAVVSIKTDSQQGTGFFVDKSGFIVTNAHLLKGSTFIQVNTYDHKVYSAVIVGTDSKADIALLGIASEVEFPTLELGSSDKVSSGDLVVAIGNPGGFDFSVAKGVISSVDRQDKNKVPMFQMDISINPGNSGGPLINAKGQAIGMNSGYTISALGLERLGFAIKSNYVKEIIGRWTRFG